MFHALLQWLRRILPPSVRTLYHRALSWIAAMWYGHPSKHMVVIGVTGTSGKTTTAYFIAHALEARGDKTGMLTTALFKIGNRSWDNTTKMTMLGRFQTQKWLRRMRDAGCRYAIIETSSQGIAQYRHEHIAFDVVVLTNLWPEHVEAHGGFENYKRAKVALFGDVAALPSKVLNGAHIPRVEVLNGLSEHAPSFVKQGFERVVQFGVAPFAAEQVQTTLSGSSFHVNGVPVALRMPGVTNVHNALAAFAVAASLDFSPAEIADALQRVPPLAGRYEQVSEGQSFTVMVDFAFEPVAVTKLYDLAAVTPHDRIIHVLGSCGGGRDVARRPVLGKIAGERANIVIVTNEDPYDDDVRQIIDDVAAGAVAAGKRDGIDLFRIDDRDEAIQRAMQMAQGMDLVLITGKGSEPVMAVAGGKKIPWSDVETARRALRLTRNR
jgi:UDP-N-acetylmuramoyl-L-alanyl-D-glutamate--2,6-diaminopimelate ligase